MSEILPLQMVCEMAKNIPCSPWLLPKLVKMLENPASNAHDVELLILKDSGLAAATLKMANSAFFNKGHRCDSLKEAVIILGFKGLYKMAASSIASRWLTNEVKGYGWEPGDLAKHSLCVAVASELLAKAVHPDLKPELAYTAGLLHDVGKLALAYACSAQFEKIRLHQQEKGCSWRQAEHDLLGYDHSDIGGTLLEAWEFPENLVQVALYYARPSLAGPDSQSLVVHIHAAKHIALQIGLGVGEDGFRTELDEALLAAYGYDADTFEELVPQILVESEKVIEGI